MIKTFLIITSLYSLSFGIIFPLGKSRETCLTINNKGGYQFQYVVSGIEPEKYICTIYGNGQIKQNITDVTEYQTTISFQTDSGNKICFSSLDTQSKQVSFDIIHTDDPLKDHFSDKQQQEVHLQLFNAFQLLQRIYRDQHMFIERSIVYQNILANKEITIVFIIIFKIIIAMVLGAYQLLVIKQIISKQTHGYRLPPGVQDNSDDDL